MQALNVAPSNNRAVKYSNRTFTDYSVLRNLASIMGTPNKVKILGYF